MVGLAKVKPGFLCEAIVTADPFSLCTFNGAAGTNKPNFAAHGGSMETVVLLSDTETVACEATSSCLVGAAPNALESESLGRLFVFWADMCLDFY